MLSERLELKLYDERIINVLIIKFHSEALIDTQVYIYKIKKKFKGLKTFKYNSHFDRPILELCLALY